jgi:protein-disulfide isomerase/uncharacterized membrane protein
MTARARLLLVALLMAASAVVALLLLMQHHGEPVGTGAVSQICGEGETSGCDAVNRSRWSSVGPVPLAAIGVAFSGSMALLALLAAGAGPDLRRGASGVLFLALAAALAVDLLLLGVQAFSIKAFCKLCIVTYVLNAAALFVLWDSRRALAAGTPPLTAEGEGRVLATGWIAGTLAVAIAAIGLNAALGARAQVRTGGMLGTAPAGDSRAEVARLQGILDDPRKLNEYMTDKQHRDYETSPVASFAVARAPVKGHPQAPVRIVEFSDFLCPWCQRLAQAFHGWVPTQGDRVGVHFKHFPLDKECNTHVQNTVHPGACNYAYGAVCAQEQGKFWEFHDRVFREPRPDPKLADIVALGVEVGAARPAFEACLASSRPRDAVAQDVAEGASAKVGSTPSIFVQGRRLPSLDYLERAVARESARLGLPAGGSPPAR